MTPQEAPECQRWHKLAGTGFDQPIDITTSVVRFRHASSFKAIFSAAYSGDAF